VFAQRPANWRAAARALVGKMQPSNAADCFLLGMEQGLQHGSIQVGQALKPRDQEQAGTPTPDLCARSSRSGSLQTACFSQLQKVSVGRSQR